MSISKADLGELRAAKELLERPGLAVRLTNLLGTPIERGFALLPEKWSDAIHEAVQGSLQKTLRAALVTLDPGARKKRPFDRLHKVAVVGTGGIGGAFGWAALAIELPISTALMLRSVADIARSEGEDLSTPEAQLACLEVFALGGPSSQDDAAETGYYAIRSALAKSMSAAAEHVAQRGLSAEGSPAVVRFIAKIGERFGVSVSEKAAAAAIPILGALGGAAVNAIFMDHFQNMARGHFKIRRLEREYGRDLILAAYNQV